MDTLLLELLPLILGATLAPIYPILVLLLLQSEHGLAKALAFVGGAVAVRLLQGVLFGLAFAPAVAAESEAGLALLGPTLLTVVGVLLLAAGVKKWRKVPDEDDPPQWMSKLSEFTVLKAAGGGALLVLVAVKQWVFTLSAIAVIEEAQPGFSAGVIFYLLFVAATQVLALAPILAFAIAPRRAAAPLRAGQEWLQRHNRTIMIAVSLLFGAWFLFKGVSSLLAAGA